MRDARLADAKPDQRATDIGVKDGRIAAIAPRLGGGAGEQVQERTLPPRPAANYCRSTGRRTGVSLTTYRANSIRHRLACLR